MLQVVQYWILASYVLGIVLAVDVMRRPISAWQEAGRERRFWCALTLVLGFHGLGEYAAVAYVAGVIPRFRRAVPAQRRPALQWLGRAVAIRPGERTAVEVFALVAALLAFASSFIHTAAIADHLDYYWLFGAFFAVVTCAQAVWAVLVYTDPLNRRLLLLGAMGSAALAVIWAISRTAGVPLGPQPWQPEPVGGADVLSTLDELATVVLVGVVLAARRGGAPISRIHIRVASMIAGPLFIYSVLLTFGGVHHHH
jgi:hypothetical protein